MLKIIFLFLMSGGIPVAIAMAGASLIYLMIQDTTPPFVVIHRMVSGIDSFPLLAVPFFILAGNLMNNAGITNRIYNYALALVGWLKGGLGHVNVLGSVIFAGMSGTAIADAAGLGTIEIKAMTDHGYSKEFSVGVTAASATLGPIIPPSLPFVIYGMMANVSVGALFLAGILPGALMALLMMLTVAYFAHKNNWGSDVKFEWLRIAKALAESVVVIAWPLAIWYLVTTLGFHPQWTVFIALIVLFAADKVFDFQAVLPIMTPVLLIGGMSTGVFTPTEGAGVGAAATFVAALLKGEIDWGKFKNCFYATAESSAMIFLIFIGADMMNSALALTQVPNQLAGVVNGWGLSPLMVVVAILIFYVVLGAVMDELSRILLTIPIFFPMVMGLDFGMPKESVAIWFGIMVLMVVEFGLLAPPVGLNVYVVNGMAKNVPIAESYRGVMPFLVSDTLRTLLLLFFPGISLWAIQYLT